MILYKNKKTMAYSPDGDTDVLRGDTLVPYIFTICQDYLLQTSTDTIKEFFFTLKKTGSRRYSEETMTDADNADGAVLFANTLA